MGFFSQLLGGKDSKNDLAAGKAASDAALKTGETEGQAQLDAAGAKLQPIAKGGQDTYSRLLDSLGVNGATAQGGVEDEYMRDPIQNQLMDRITRANTRRFTSMMPGSSGNNSGAATQSLTNNLLDQWRTYQAQLQTAAAPGIAATGQQSQFLKDKGDMAYGYGATQAGNEINYAKSKSDLESTGINNLLKIVGAGSQAATAGAKVATAFG